MNHVSLNVGSGGQKLVEIRQPSEGDITVGFSNLCPASHEGFDREFAALYEVLQSPTRPAVVKRPVPINARTLSEHYEIPYGDCAKGAYIEYRR